MAKYIPAEVMRKMTIQQLKVIATQKNTKNKFSDNALRAQKILWYATGRTHFMTGTYAPLSMNEKGWSVPQEESVDIKPYLNGTEVENGL